jgi:hypothetical protein
MNLYGSMLNNLASAVRSARCLRGHPVHADTLGHWAALLDHARRELGEGTTEQILDLTLELEKELAQRAN